MSLKAAVDMMKWQATDNTLRTVAVTSSLILASYIWTRRRRKLLAYDALETRPRGRIMSFTSASMAMGAFPEEAKVPEPIINAAIFFKPGDCPQEHDLVDVVSTFLQYERCAGIPMEGSNEWRIKIGTDSLDPIKLIRLIETKGDDAATYDAITAHMQDALSEGRGDLPWWELLLINNQGSGMSACVIRMHHCIADGLSLVTLVEQFITYTDGSPMEGLIPQSMNKKFQRKESKFTLVYKTLQSLVKVLTNSASRFDDDTVFSKGVHKSMVHTRKRKPILFEPIPLDFAKKLKSAANVTLNDILFTCLSQAIHEYCKEQNCPVLRKKGDRIQCRALLPVGFPRPDHETTDKTRTLRNKWAFISCEMGVGVDNQMDRLNYVHNHLKELKNSPYAFVQLSVQETLPPILPFKVSKQTLYDTFVRHSLVFSNVPGPPRPCSFGGKEAVGVQMFYNNLIPQVGLISYRGQIFGNMIVDPDALPNCESFAYLYSQAFVNLANALDVDVPKSIQDHANHHKIQSSS
jgi:hypothetical protein